MKCDPLVSPPSPLYPCQELCTDAQTACSSSSTDMAVVTKLLNINFTATCPRLPPSPACTTIAPASTASSPPLPKCISSFQSSVCGSIPYPVYVPAGKSINDLEAAAQSRQFLFAFKSGPVCGRVLTDYLCSRFFPRCDSGAVARATGNQLPLPIPFPRFPCRSLCDRFTSDCALFLQTLNNPALYPNCSSAGTVAPAATYSCNNTMIVTAALDDFPVSSSVFGLLPVAPGVNVPLSTSCWDPALDNATAALTSSFICPAPLVLPDNPADSISVSQCASPCPSFVFDSSAWDSVRVLIYVCSWLSLLTTAFTLITWLVFPVKRRQLHFLNFNIAIFGISLVMVASALGEPRGHIKNASCKNNASSLALLDGGWCAGQGVLLHFFSVAAVTWWCLLALEVWLRTKYPDKSKQSAWRNTVYVPVGWGLPLALVVVALASKAYGGKSILPWCMFANEAPFWTEWTAFYYPVFIMIFSATVFLCLMMKEVLVTTAAVRSKAAQAIFFRSILLITIFFFIFGFIAAWRAVVYFRQDSYTASGTQFISCLLGGKSGCRQTDTPNLALWYLLNFVVSAQGVLVFFALGIQPDNFYLWRNLIVNRSTSLKSSVASQDRDRDRERGDRGERGGAAAGASGSNKRTTKGQPTSASASAASSNSPSTSTRSSKPSRPNAALLGQDTPTSDSMEVELSVTGSGGGGGGGGSNSPSQTPQMQTPEYRPAEQDVIEVDQDQVRQEEEQDDELPPPPPVPVPAGGRSDDA